MILLNQTVGRGQQCVLSYEKEYQLLVNYVNTLCQNTGSATKFNSPDDSSYTVMSFAKQKEKVLK